MSSTTFIDGATPVVASWLNDVNTATYTTVPALSTTVGTHTTQIASLSSTKAASGANTDIVSLNSPAIGAATATTQTAGDNTTKVATTAFVSTAVTGSLVFASLAEAQAGTNTTKAVSPSTMQNGKSVQQAMVAVTSGTSKDFTSIPSWVTEIFVFFKNVSLTGSANFLIQPGTGGSPTVSGYSSYYGYVVNDTNASTLSSTTGFGVSGGNPAGTLNGFIHLVLMDSATNTWTSSHSMGSIGSTAVVLGGGSVALSGVLDMVRVTSTTGTDPFDAGNLSIRYK
jgi:hypothetical protein